MLFAIPLEYRERRQRDLTVFYCPNGHKQSYGESETARALREAEAMAALKTAELAALREILVEALAAERSAVARARRYKGLAKMHRDALHRAGNGKSPTVAEVGKEVAP